MISVLTLALAPTFFVMLLGYTAGRAGIVNNMHVAELNTVVMGYALPASLLVATASTPPIRKAFFPRPSLPIATNALHQSAQTERPPERRSFRKCD
jgi:predicted permease